MVRTITFSHRFAARLQANASTSHAEPICKSLVNLDPAILHSRVLLARVSAPNLLVIQRSRRRRRFAMALINRMSRLFSADVHAVLDRI